MVETKIFSLKAEILVHIPADITQNRQRLEDVKDGIKKAVTKGLYDEGIDFEVEKLALDEEK
ncbi:MAG: hypothetical protein ABI347_10785 [Nitrososphaera sp.]|jgi:hypothetical protein